MVAFPRRDALPRVQTNTRRNEYADARKHVPPVEWQPTRLPRNLPDLRALLERQWLPSHSIRMVFSALEFLNPNHMSLIFERVLTDGIAAVSDLIGDDEEGTAAVIDPRPDVEMYLELARKNGVSITHIFETHIHADLVSGSLELADRTQTAKIYASGEGGAEYGFAIEPVKDGDEFKFGALVLTARHSPGHTPEHICYVAADEEHPDFPWGVFTGDSLFVNSAGRPDLLGRDADKLASQLYDTLWELYAKLDDSVIIHPSHGSGSPCGADIGANLGNTGGFEKRFNPYYQRKERKDFVEYALATPPPEATYYKT